MPGIFISYRRTDTLPWAGHLFADLRDGFYLETACDRQPVPAATPTGKVRHR